MGVILTAIRTYLLDGCAVEGLGLKEDDRVWVSNGSEQEAFGFKR